MLVFDDVWNVEFWQAMKDALPDNDKGSRIIITTRSETVVASCKQSSFDHVHKLEPLSEAMCWDLFCRIAFQNEPESLCPPEFEQFSREFIRMCEGLPLAIVDVAKLLSEKKKKLSEWSRLLDFSFEVESNFHLTGASKILALGYLDLPPQLKLCFLYFSIFPKDSLIPNDKLYKLWIAEGFVQEKAGKTLEMVAEEYLNELIRRNMVQACEGFYELEKFCQVHDLMYEIARQKADEFGFYQIQGHNNSGFAKKIRCLSVYNSVESVLESVEDTRVRSVFLFNIDTLNNSFVINLFERYKLLTLLDFEDVPLELLPEELGNLFHMKYLNLKNTKLRRLPKSVGKLHNLQTLDLRNTLLIELPTEINKLQNLRHLLASGYDKKISLVSTQGVRIKEGIGCLENLQTLMTVESYIPGSDLVKELEKLRQLRKLGISRLTTEVASSLFACIGEMRHLEYLSLDSMSNHEILDLEAISSPLRFLQRLVLKGILLSLPNWIPSLQNLSMLCLSCSRLSYDPLEYLRRLPNLVSLWLYRAYDGVQLQFEKEGFRKLKLLVIRELHGLNFVHIEEGALPCLEELRIGSSPLLNEVPSGVQHLRNLKVLAYYDMPSEFVLSMQPDGGSYYSIVEHVPSVLFWYRVKGRRYVLYKLGEPDLLDRLQGIATNINDVQQRDIRLSFSYSDGEEETASTQNDINRLSFSSDRFSFFSDDIED
ncbi:NB-ARC domain, LRR domain containing protein [Trema orientale]|uniref:NB-ARC domain, LRR domain containing protein n=1 Tax=Trema orientale TaxID=63057 RepID=A0A2P5EMI8_TREOI|nr:NB-ARC domain, LRR domain containing protein [Trema orientale]